MLLRYFRPLLLTFAAQLICGAPPLLSRTLYLAPNGDDQAPCENGAVFRTLKRAASCLAPGDTLIIRKGTFQGGVEFRIKASETSPVVIRGENLESVIEGSGEMPDGIRIEGSSHILIDNLCVREAGRAGCGVRHSDHVTITRSLFADNGRWGIFTSFADDIRFEDNECRGSKMEHGIYHSNSGDRFVIRGNRVHDNRGNGIHMNGDPEIKGGDGVLNWGLVERNIVYRNGPGGGAGINMTHVHDVLVRINLLYRNVAGGITVYQDTGTFEQGSKRVLIMGNTVYYAPDEGRSGINVQTTSEKVMIAGNIFVSGGKRGNIEVNSDHLASVLSDFNILWGVDPEQMFERKDSLLSLQAWGSLSGNDTHSKHADPRFTGLAGDDYSLSAASPAVDAGMPEKEVRERLEKLGGCEWLLERLNELPAEDILQNGRPQGHAPDAGAFERNE
ncbi:MAG: hypothetical protein A3F83_14155 [Candidatus Glassbacteria bacterium RIFCSPLOWO2_12_FULL_58_11]|uniref:Right handed beta helix domain-containing protein n=1 Tax=Candidatus Glassbacteria bacterium RIFCSPLOWO2_12_FULL_58_11 TaxID=1817867 RepID=A0A1F5YYX5_9BACT|nr:MAG: hypothetical protein A3F83_14155 [Candidatus Glassbacteria bacterium RIFCSPLOWO2_12_FULL_58_11]